MNKQMNEWIKMFCIFSQSLITLDFYTELWDTAIGKCFYYILFSYVMSIFSYVYLAFTHNEHRNPKREVITKYRVVINPSSQTQYVRTNFIILWADINWKSSF